MAQPADPSSSVPPDLMPHIHLVSSYRYATMSRLDVNEIAKWLMNAPQVARDRAPFFWTYLDKPMDGTMLLTWQPLQRMGTNYATDGFVWTPESLFKHDLNNGLILEIYVSKQGYIPGVEQHALHTKRRFRLVQIPGQMAPIQPDISLFIVHYGPCEPSDRVPVSMIPFDERINAFLQQRHYLLQQGHIRRKEFMLSDHASWPSLPELTRRQMGPQMTPRGIPQQMAYPPQTTPGPPAKRARHSQGPGQPAPMPALLPDSAFDDEEDTSRGDMFDHLSPREISLSRYQQNHEWMEEILSSPYRIQQITPPDLGLGLKGELASLTEGIFIAQGGDAFNTVPDKPYVGRLDQGQAEDFRKRVNEHIESTKAEIEKMQTAHSQALAEFKKTSNFTVAEREMRGLEDDSGFEIRQGDDGSVPPQQTPVTSKIGGKSIDDLAGEVEMNMNRKLGSRPLINRVQEGGFQAPAPEPQPEPEPEPELEVLSTEKEAPQQQPGLSPPSATMNATEDAAMSRQHSQAGSHMSGMMGESDVDMGNTAAGLLDELHNRGFSSTSTPNNLNEGFTPQAQQSMANSSAATPQDGKTTSAAEVLDDPPAQSSEQQQQQQQLENNEVDETMTGVEMDKADENAGTTPDRGTGSGDWVVVPKEEAAAAAAAAATPNVTTEIQQEVPTMSNDVSAAHAGTPSAEPSAPSTAATAADTVAPPGPKAVSAAATPAVADSAGAGGSLPFEQDDFHALANLDPAAGPDDALGTFDEDSGGREGDAHLGGENLDLNMDMEDSAFGDAFHGVETAASPGGDEPQ